MEKVGRRILLLFSFAGMFACLIVLTISISFTPAALESEGLPHPLAIVSVISVLAYVVSFAVGLGMQIS